MWRYTVFGNSNIFFRVQFWLSHLNISITDKFLQRDFAVATLSDKTHLQVATSKHYLPVTGGAIPYCTDKGPLWILLLWDRLKKMTRTDVVRTHDLCPCVSTLICHEIPYICCRDYTSYTEVFTYINGIMQSGSSQMPFMTYEVRDDWRYLLMKDLEEYPKLDLPLQFLRYHLEQNPWIFIITSSSSSFLKSHFIITSTVFADFCRSSTSISS